MVEGGGSCGGGSRRRVVRESGSPVGKALGDAEPEKERGFKQSSEEDIGAQGE